VSFYSKFSSNYCNGLYWASIFEIWLSTFSFWTINLPPKRVARLCMYRNVGNLISLISLNSKIISSTYPSLAEAYRGSMKFPSRTDLFLWRTFPSSVANGFLQHVMGPHSNHMRRLDISIHPVCGLKNSHGVCEIGTPDWLCRKVCCLLHLSINKMRKKVF
jgi:hypothetical protein